MFRYLLFLFSCFGNKNSYKQLFLVLFYRVLSLFRAQS